MLAIPSGPYFYNYVYIGYYLCFLGGEALVRWAGFDLDFIVLVLGLVIGCLYLSHVYKFERTTLPIRFLASFVTKYY